MQRTEQPRWKKINNSAEKLLARSSSNQKQHFQQYKSKYKDKQINSTNNTIAFDQMQANRSFQYGILQKNKLPRATNHQKKVQYRLGQKLQRRLSKKEESEKIFNQFQTFKQQIFNVIKQQVSQSISLDIETKITQLTRRYETQIKRNKIQFQILKMAKHQQDAAQAQVIPKNMINNVQLHEKQNIFQKNIKLEEIEKKKRKERNTQKQRKTEGQIYFRYESKENCQLIVQLKWR